MNRPPHDPSVFAEPHLSGQAPCPGAAEAPLCPRAAADVEQTVWDEPALSPELAGPPGSETYENWLKRRWRATPLWKSWAWTALVILAAGPWAVIGAFYGAFEGVGGVLMLVLFAPLVEEMMKVALVVWTIERAPYLFRSGVQVLLCAAAAGLAFAAIENVLYLKVYIAEPEAWLIVWRWTVCVALHVGCSLVAGVGALLVWRSAIRNWKRPQLASMAPWLIAAIIMHSAYNASALVMEWAWR